ncbi:hypothetical protein MLD38_009138 [Melastoma candidum]|uniref:Uncharacterized protein n=1 Tax=Melastoma candidum TaxID=119954 RepID=A0ACB9RVQ4_9MYRT|nr:hypothetical protein MLD38_009138 [Melastoma candidum]
MNRAQALWEFCAPKAILRELHESAFKLGLGAGGQLCLVHVLVNLLGGCNNCIYSRRVSLQKDSWSQQLILPCLILTWFTLAIWAVVTGTLPNDKLRASCPPYFMLIGGIACFVHLFLAGTDDYSWQLVGIFR